MTLANPTEPTQAGKHTPGPWRQGKACDSVVSDFPIGTIAGADDVKYYGGHLIAESVASQNRPLVIAAPALLAACKIAHEVMRGSPHLGDRPVYDTLVAAIAAAEGRLD